MEEKVYINGPDNHQRSRVGANNVMALFLKAHTADRRLASFWFAMSIKPEGWAFPPLRDPIAGDYATAGGWIRLHTNAPHHRDAALDVLGLLAAAGRPTRLRRLLSHVAAVQRPCVQWRPGPNIRKGKR